MTVDLSPGVYSFEEEPQVRQIQGAPTSVIGMVGVTERGEVGKAKSKTSWGDWVQEYGSYVSYSDAPQSVFASFLNGAREIVFTRTLHYSDITNPLSGTGVKANGALNNAGAGSANAAVYGREKGPFALANGQTLIVKRNGVAQPTLTFAATKAIANSGNTENQDMSGGKDLTVKVDNGPVQTINFVDGDFVDPANATAEEVAAVINGQIVGASAEDAGGAVRIESDSPGSNSRIQVTGGTAQTEWSWPASTVGTGNVANITAVTVAEIKSLLEALVALITVQDDGLGRVLITHDEAGSTKTLEVDAASTADTPLGFDNNVHAGLDANGAQAQKTSTLAGPWILATGDDLDITTDLGGPTSTTFTGTKASVESNNTETQNMAGGKTLNVRVNGGNTQAITFVDGDFSNPAAATAEEFVEAANKQLSGARFKLNAGKDGIIFESDRAGTSSRVEVTGGDAQTLWDFPVLGVGTGNVENIGAVTYEEVKALVEAAVVGVRVTSDENGKLVITRTSPGAGKTLDTPSGTALAKFAFTAGVVNGTTGAPTATLTQEGKTEGAYANDLITRIQNATSGKADEFNLFILKSGVVQEFKTNLTMGAYSGGDLPSDEKYAPVVLNDEDNGSNLLEYTDSLINGTAADRRPANGDYSLSSGNNGTTGLIDTDYLGDSGAKNGLRAFDTVNSLGILAVPGVGTSAVHNGMLTYCEVTRRGKLFAVLDPPQSQSVDQVIEYVTNTASLKDSSEYGAFYYPELKVTNPNPNVFGNSKNITIPPSGPVTGMYARTDNSIPGGVYLQPAGVEEGLLRGVLGLENDAVKDEGQRDKLYPQNINSIWSDRGVPMHADGSANLKRNGNFPSIGERRGVIFIKASLETGLLFAKHKNNTRANRLKVENSINAFLKQQMDRDAFSSKDPSKAYYVDMGPALNSQVQQFNRRMQARIGLATAKPAEFIVLLISQDTRALQEELAG